MHLPDEEGHLIRRYFLGDLTEEERVRFEERVFTDGDFKTHVLIVEDELVEDYAARLLPADEAEKFEKHFLTTPEQQQKLKYVNRLRVRAAREQPAPAVAAESPRRESPSRFRFPPASRKGRAAAIVVTLLVAVVAAVLWRTFGNRAPSEELIRWKRLQAEIAELNRSGLSPRGAAENLLAVPLSSSLLRGGAGPKIVLPEGNSVVQFRLNLPPEDYGSYGVGLENADGDKVFSFGRLTANSLDGKRVLILYVPSDALTPDDYRLRLNGVSDTDSAAPLGDYPFRVVSQ
jgi:hypothetical protein